MRYWVMLAMLLMLPVGAMVAQIDTDVCYTEGYMPPRLVGGMYAQVIADQPLMAYADPTTGASVVGQVEPGTLLSINSAPRCVDGLVWWQSDFRPVTGPNDFPAGWFIEGRDGQYFLEPYLQTVTVPTNRQPITPDNLAQLQQVGQVEYGMVDTLQWSPDGGQLAINTVGAVWVHDLQGGQGVRLNPNRVDTNLTDTIVFGEDVIALGGSSSNDETSDGLFTRWSMSGEQTAEHVVAVEDFGNATAISPDLGTLATFRWTGEIDLWDAATGAPLFQLMGHTVGGALTFSPDGRYLISSGGGGMMQSDPTLRIWETATWKQIALLEAGFYIKPLDFHANLMALPNSPETADGVAKISLIDMGTGIERMAISLGAGQSVVGADFSADGRWLYVVDTAAFDGDGTSTLKIFDTSSGAVLAERALDFPARQMAVTADNLIVLVYDDPDFWGPNRVTFWALPQ